MLFIDQKYVSIIGAGLRNFRKEKTDLWNCSCFLCGDSKKDKSKARGYFYKHKGGMWYKCHNCGQSGPLSYYIKEHFTDLHDEYRRDNISSSLTKVYSEKEDKVGELDFSSRKVPKFKSNPKTEEPLHDAIMDGLHCVKDLVDDHPVVAYVRNRAIPEEFWGDIYYADRYKDWVNERLPNKFDKDSLKRNNTPRLALPFLDKHGRCFAMTFRAFGKEQPKYLTVKFTEEDKIFGLERVDLSKPVRIVEGPINSYFVKNCVAMAGSDLKHVPFVNYVKIYDNDTRNREIVKKVKKSIDAGEAVCLWDSRVSPHEDINDLAMNRGMTPEQITQIIDECTYKGLAAKLKFKEWSKINV